MRNLHEVVLSSYWTTEQDGSQRVLCPADSQPAAARYREEVLSRTRGGCVNRARVTQRHAMDIPLPDLIHQLRYQRRRISALSRKSGALRNRGIHLLAESKSLAARVEQSCTNLASAYLTTKSAVAELSLRRSGKNGGTPIPNPPSNVPEVVLADSPDLVEALAQATDILKMEFADTDGSGHETLVKCEKVLQRSYFTQTIELPLF